MAGRIFRIVSGTAFADLVLAACVATWHYAFPEAAV